MDVSYNAKMTITNFVIAGGIGAVIKHFVPSDRFNKFIPAVNVLAMWGMYASQGMDPFSALVAGAVTALGASKAHDEVVNGTPLKNVMVPKYWAKDGVKQGL
jgi:hypothetical protein